MSRTTPIPAMSNKIAKLTKELEWYKAYADSVEASNHRAHEYACEHADEITGVIQYPYAEGDDYWTLEGTEEVYNYNNGGVIAVQSCWDDQSEEIHTEHLMYFDSLDEILKYSRDRFNFVKVSCFDSGYPDIKTGDYFVVDLDTGKFKKSN